MSGALVSGRLRRGRAHGGDSAISGTLEWVSTWSFRRPAKTMQAAAWAYPMIVPTIAAGRKAVAKRARPSVRLCRADA